MAGINNNTKYMIHLNNDFTDVKGKITTPSGDTFIASTKFGSGAIHFNGVNEYLTVPDSGDWDIFATTTESWTIDMYVKLNTISGEQVTVSQAASGTDFWQLKITSGILSLQVFNGIEIIGITGNTPIVVDTWTHLALIKVGINYGLYLDGIQIGYVSDNSIHTVAAVLTIGKFGNLNQWYLSGHMDELRIKKSNYFGVTPDVGLTSSFTPSSVEYLTDPGTVFGITGDGTDGQTTQTDLTGRHNTISFNNGAKIDVSIAKYGTGSMEFTTGTASFVSIGGASPRTDFDISSSIDGAKTVSFWVYITANGGLCRYMRPGTPGNAWELSYLNGVLNFTHNPIGLAMSTPSASLLNQWTHISIIRVNNNYGLYVNGSNKVKSTSNNTFNLTDGDLWLGANTTDHFSGRIDDFHVITGNPFNADPTSLLDTVTTPTQAQSIILSNTKLLLHFNESLIDDSAAGNNITAVGSPLLVGPKFGTGAGFFDGVDDYLEVVNSSSFDFGVSDFTIETWVNFSDVSGFSYIYFKRTGSGANELEIRLGQGSGDGKLFFNTNNGTPVQAVSTSSLNINTWYHLAFVRSGTTNKIYINGVEDGSATGTIQNMTSTTNATIGATPGGGSPTLGLFDDFRISNIARYTIGFSTPTIAQVADANTTLLLNFNSDFSDSSTIGNSVNASGDATTIASVFGTGSVLLNTTNYMTVADNPDWDLGTGDFTIECWTKLKAYPAEHCFISTNNSLELMFEIDNPGVADNLRAGLEGSVYSFGNPSMVLNIWYHVALVRVAGSLSAYVDGTQVGSSQASSDNINISSLLRLGGRIVNNRNIDGYLDEYRISNTARYLSNFTVPTAEFVNDANTKLLIHFNGSYIDSSTSAHVVTAVNSPILQNSKFGIGMLDMDGTGDYLTVPDSPSLDIGANLSEDWTISFWVKHRSFNSPADQYYMEHKQDGSNRWLIDHDAGSGNGIRFIVLEGGAVNMNLNFAGSITDNTTWHHIAVCRVGNDWGMYLDGNQISSVLSNTNLFNFTGTLYIGSEGTSSNFFNGNMDEVLIQNSNIYAANPSLGNDSFTVPTSEHNSDANTKLLLHFNDGLKDDSGLVNTVTKVNKAQISDTVFGTKNGIFNGTSQYLSIPDNVSFDLFDSTLSDATIDFWVKFNGNYDNQYLYQQYQDASNNLYIANFGAGPYSLDFSIISGGVSILNMTSPGISDDFWHHVALIKKGTDYGIYIDGVKVSTGSLLSTVNLNAEITIGLGKPSNYFEGQLDDFRVTNANSFNADPTTSLDIIVPTAAHTTDINTKLLIPFDEDFIDISGLGHIITPVNTPTIVATAMLGEGSSYFDGAGDFLTTPDSSDWDLFSSNSSNATIDFWVKFNGNYDNQYLYQQYQDNNNRIYIANFQSGLNHTIAFTVIEGGVVKVNMNVFGLDKGIGDDNWHHVALIKKGTDYGIYIDGTIKQYLNWSGTANISGSVRIGVSYFNNAPSASTYFKGNLDEYRIHTDNYFNTTPDVGLTSSFIPPTVEYTQDPAGRNQVIIIT